MTIWIPDTCTPVHRTLVFCTQKDAHQALIWSHDHLIGQTIWNQDTGNQLTSCSSNFCSVFEQWCPNIKFWTKIWYSNAIQKLDHLQTGLVWTIQVPEYSVIQIPSVFCCRTHCLHAICKSKPHIKNYVTLVKFKLIKIWAET